MKIRNPPKVTWYAVNLRTSAVLNWQMCWKSEISQRVRSGGSAVVVHRRVSVFGNQPLVISVVNSLEEINMYAHTHIHKYI